VRKPQKHDFSVKLTRVIEGTGGPGVELATPEDAARFMGKMRPFRQRWPHWDYAAELVLIAPTTGEEADIERATARMERALRRDGGFDAPRRRNHILSRRGNYCRRIKGFLAATWWLCPVTSFGPFSFT
jgi:hypothetical protein